MIYGGGFREAGEAGKAREARLIGLAREGGMRLIGPNCLGVVNMTERMYAAFGSMTHPPLLPAGHVSMVFQSGGFGHSLALRCAAAGAGFRYFVASGNETDITTPELIDCDLDDPVTKIVVSYAEGVTDGRALLEAGRKAAQLGKPILLWKSGRGEQGLKAAASHTASMTGRYDVFRAALAQAGIIEVRDMEEVADLVQMLSAGRLPRGPRVGLVGGSGGSAIVFADAADEEELKLPALARDTARELRGFVPEITASSNPVDFAAGTALPMIAELRGRAVLAEVRGRSAADVDALAQALARVSDLAWEMRDRPAELDIDPLFVRPQGRGVVAGDALAVVLS